MTCFTDHAVSRMQQRVIDPRVALLAVEYGKHTANHDKLMLTLDDIPPKVFKTLDKRVQKLAEKQLPIVVWVDGYVVITAARVLNKRVNMRPSSIQHRVAAHNK